MHPRRSKPSTRCFTPKLVAISIWPTTWAAQMDLSKGWLGLTPDGSRWCPWTWCIMGPVIVVPSNRFECRNPTYPEITVTTSPPSYTTSKDTIQAKGRLPAFGAETGHSGSGPKSVIQQTSGNYRFVPQICLRDIDLRLACIRARFMS